ncbi:MAG: beta-galactosidase trimerization domain-containing protein [Terriglobia bacterium]
MKRRMFLKSTAGGLSVFAGWPGKTSAEEPELTILESPRAGNIPEDGYTPPDWLRYASTIYFEGYAPPIWPHIREFDAKRLVEIVLELGGDTLRFQPLGHVAYYPSKVYPVHPELEGRDLINEVSRECRRAGVHLYCYCVYCNEVDISVLNDPRCARWVLHDAEGKPYGRVSSFRNGEEIGTCATGDAYRQMIRTVVRELCAHDTDGVYFDAPSAYRKICFCESCRKGYRQFSGLTLDRLRNVRDPAHPASGADLKALGAWYDWANKLTAEDLEDFRRIIHGSGKFMLCHNGATWRPGSLHTQYRYADGFMVEYSAQFYQRLHEALMGGSMARPTKKLAQNYMGSYDVCAIGEPPHSRPWAPHCIDLEDGDEILMQGFANLAGGNMPIYVSANRLLYGIGSGSPNPTKEAFALVHRAESVLKDSVPISFVSIVPTAESLELWRTGHKSWNMTMSESFGLVMLDERISFDVNPSTELNEEWLKTQRVVALCGASGLSDEDARLLTRWVQEGGGLLATYDSGLYGEDGRLREDGGALKEVLGVEMKGVPLGTEADCFYQTRSAHPALGDYRKGTMMLGDERLVEVEVRPEATILADCMNLDTGATRGPAIILNHFGRGRAIYISGSLEAFYTASRVVSLRRVLGSIVRYLGGNEPMPFSISAPQGTYGMLRRTREGDLALWVCANIGFKDAAVGVMRQTYAPISNVEIRVLVPHGRSLRSVRLMRADRSVPFTMAAGYAVTRIPELHIGELVHFMLE